MIFVLATEIIYLVYFKWNKQFPEFDAMLKLYTDRKHGMLPTNSQNDLHYVYIQTLNPGKIVWYFVWNWDWKVTGSISENELVCEHLPFLMLKANWHFCKTELEFLRPTATFCMQCNDTFNWLSFSTSFPDRFLHRQIVQTTSTNFNYIGIWDPVHFVATFCYIVSEISGWKNLFISCMVLIQLILSNSVYHICHTKPLDSIKI